MRAVSAASPSSSSVLGKRLTEASKGATAEQQMPALSIGSKNVEGVGLENLLIAHRRHGRQRHELAGVENVAIEFDVFELEARYRCHARFETHGFRHGAPHQTGIATHCFPLLSVLEQLSRLDGESATGRIMPATMTKKVESRSQVATSRRPDRPLRDKYSGNRRAGLRAGRWQAVRYNPLAGLPSFQFQESLRW
jgi:hypothetical protein